MRILVGMNRCLLFQTLDSDAMTEDASPTRRLISVWYTDIFDIYFYFFLISDFNHRMSLNGLLCADVPLRTYTLTLNVGLDEQLWTP